MPDRRERGVRDGQPLPGRRLRPLREGIDRERFREQTGFELDALLGNRLNVLVAEGLLADDGTVLLVAVEGSGDTRRVVTSFWTEAAAWSTGSTP